MTLAVPASKLIEPEGIPQPRFSISVLGPMRAAANGRDIKLRKRKARALLAYLALTNGCQETRERLVGLLWSDSEEDKARSSLRQVLHELTEDLVSAGYAGMTRDRMRVVLDPVGLQVDCQDILDMARGGKIHPRLIDEPLISEAYLRDLDDIDPAFAVWARARRQGFHDHLLQHLQAILHADSLSTATRRECAQAILNLDPTHEEACRALMRICVEMGDTTAALRAYNALWDLLENEYDTEPSPETMALIADIKQGNLAPASASAPASAPPGLIKVSELFPQPVPPENAAESGVAAGARLALLIEPFGINGIETDSLHLADGFRHDLIASLIRFREWFVVSGSSLSSEQIGGGRASGAYCVAATAYRADDAMSLVLTLRELESGIHIWSERFVLTLSNWFESQQKIVRQIAISLNVQISMGRLGRIAAEPVVSLAVYDLWLRGQAALNRFSPENWKTAARMFTAAIQRDPDFAPGYSSLAQMNNVAHFVHPGVRRTTEQEQRTLDLARKAVALDPMDSRSQLSLGWSLAMAKSYKQAAIHMDLARQLNPSDSWTLISSALCLGYCGKLDLATDLATQSLSLTLAPSRLHWAYQVQLAFLRGDYVEAIEAADRAEGVMIGMVAWRAAALAHLGNIREAQNTARQFLNLARSSWFSEEPPTDEAIGRWLLHMFPISTEADWTRLRDGVAAAGIPHGGARHHGW
jgi:DNA-binding SARP family transcriptional activator/TolB-like protein/Tfp pilus assembly protein PilF